MTVDALLVAVAARGLDTAATFGVVEPLDDGEWARFHAAVEHHGLTGLLALAIAAGDVPLTPAQDEHAGERELAIATHVVTVERLLLEVVERFDRLGIEHLVLKGSAFAHTAYPLPEARPFADLDLLVPADQLDRAGEVLDAMGAPRRVPELRAGFDRRFGRTVTRATADGYEVDVHRALAAGPFAFLVDPGVLFQRAAGFELAGREVRCLDPTLALLHSCIHLVLGGRPRLLTVRDVAQHADLPGVDLDVLVDAAAAWRLTAVAARAIDRARADLALGEGWQTALSARLHPTPEEVGLLEAFPARAGNADDQALQALRYVPGIRGKAAFARSFAWPSRANLRHRGLTRWSHLAHVVRRAGRGRPHAPS